MRRICIVGSGATGLALTAILKKSNIDVILTDIEKRSHELQILKMKDSFRVFGCGFNEVIQTQCIERDLLKAIDKSSLIIVALTARDHKSLAEEVSSIIREDHHILITPGNLGSVVMKDVFTRSNAMLPLLGEVESNLVVSHRISIEEVELILPMKARYVSAYPSCRTNELINAFKEVFDLKAANNIFETMLNHPNIDSHLPGCLLNLNMIKPNNKYSFYRECININTLKVIQEMYNEKMEIMENLGLTVRTKLTLLEKFADNSDEPFVIPFYNVNGPETTMHRFIDEDAYVGGAFVVSLGKYLQIDTPVTYTMVKVASVINGLDYLNSGLTFDNISLEDVVKTSNQ